MPEVMHAWPGSIARAAQTDFARQAPEDAVHVLVQQPAALLGDEEGRAATRSEMCGAPIDIVAQRRARRRMQGREARLAELGQPKCEHASRQVDVAVLQAHRLGQAHASHSDQPEQSVILETAVWFWREGENRAFSRA